MSRLIFFFFLQFIFYFKNSYAQERVVAVPFEQLVSLQKKEPRPVLVFIHTSWCRYCEGMKKYTFQKEDVKELLKKEFHFVTLNAEDSRDIIFRGHTFRYRPTGPETGQHELAEALGLVDGRLSFPTLCILNPEFEIIYQHPGFVTAQELVEILQKLIPKVK